MDNTNSRSTAHATAADFTSWADRATHMTDAELEYAAKDAAEASRAIDSYDPARAGRYMDECGTYRMEQATRRTRSINTKIA